MIKDLGSVNGTFVNGNRITECYLNAGDIVKCGALFLDWTQYLNSGRASSQPINYQQPDANAAVLQEAISIGSINQYNLKDVFRYLTTGIFEIGDLFKTSWDRTSSILFLKAAPFILTFILSVIAYTKYPHAGFYFSPLILTVLLYALSPFITMYLLSLSKKVQIDKVALASGIMGLIQFSIGLCFSVCFLVFYQNLSAGYRNAFTNSFGFDFFILVITLLFIILLVNLILALNLFIYKYFISIGISRSRSIYLIVITIVLDIFFKILSFFIVFLIAGKSIDNF